MAFSIAAILKAISIIDSVVKAIKKITGGSSHDKRELARKGIKQLLKKSKIPQKESITNLLLELGVFKNKSKSSISIEGNSIIIDLPGKTKKKKADSPICPHCKKSLKSHARFTKDFRELNPKQRSSSIAATTKWLNELKKIHKRLTKKKKR